MRVPEMAVTLCSIGPGIMRDDELLSCALALLAIKPRARGRMVWMSLIFAISNWVDE